MNLVYSCVFFNDKYLDLLEMLFKTYSKFKNDYDYLVICNEELDSKVKGLFRKYSITGDTFLLNYTTIFEAGYSRLRIFDYPHINNYEKVMYLDCDILISNSISPLWQLCLEDYLYVIKEMPHRTCHFELYNDVEISNVNREKAFTSAVLLFKNVDVIRNLFSNTLSHIQQHLKDGKKIPYTIDQPFIVYNAVNENLSNNITINEYATNRRFNTYNEIFSYRDILLRDVNFRESEKISYSRKSINHFVTGVGNFESKKEIMSIVLALIYS